MALPMRQFSRVRQVLFEYYGLRRLPRHHAQHFKCISTSSAVKNESSLKGDSEMSWVRRILQGTGPSADIDETPLEGQEVVEVEPRYMEILQETQSKFISRPEIRKRSYSPPFDIEERLEEMSLEFSAETNPASWKDFSLHDQNLKYQVLSKCAQTFQHSVPNFQLRNMKTLEDVLTFYQTPVKDTSVYDDLSTKDLPPNLRIQWDYNDSKLEVYEDYLDYIEKKGSPKPPAWPYRPSH